MGVGDPLIYGRAAWGQLAKENPAALLVDQGAWVPATSEGVVARQIEVAGWVPVRLTGFTRQEWADALRAR